ncbi:MAG TPA: tetratricopeptide repeat protein [Mycobacteriales bacterium]|nr:tetratricopeptide repeat protein [Mycobacteriales bacterium]
MSTHIWITGPTRAARRAAIQAGPDPVRVAGCHQRLRGPYTGTGEVLGALVPEAFRRWPELVEQHRVELLYTIPELSEHIGPPPDTLVGNTPYEERTRYFGVQWIRGMSQGVVNFLLAFARLRAEAGDPVPLRLAFDDVHAAEPTEQELLAILVRRADPATLAVTVGTAEEPLPPELRTALQEWATSRTAPPVPDERPARSAPELVAAYVEADGTSDDAAEMAAYEAAAAELRAQLHDARADALEADADWGTRLGALPYHRERGSDPSGVGRRVLREALDYCVATGYSAATVDFGMRGRAVCAVADQQDYCHFTAKAASALVPMGQPRECERLYRELRRLYPLPRVQMTSSYALAMLHTRFYVPRDHEAALELSNNARALATLERDPVFGPYFQVYQDNGLALIEMHRGNLEHSLQLVTDGIARLDRELPPDKYVVHRSQLLHNQTRVLAALGRLDEAYAGFTRLIEWDPYYVEYHTDRGNLCRRRGDLVAALADYDRAVEISAPFPELYYNRAELRLALGRTEEALHDLDLLLHMEPDFVEGRLSRAMLRLAAGDLDGARQDTEAGLAAAPAEPRLCCLLGRLEQERGDLDAARLAYDRALEADPAFAAALVDRAGLAYEQGEPDAAEADLTAALAVLGPDPDVLFNRGVLRLESARYEDAIVDFGAALAEPGADSAELLYRRAWAHTRAGSSALAGADLDAHLGFGASEHAEEISTLRREIAAGLVHR